MSEKLLATAVINQAIDDMLAPQPRANGKNVRTTKATIEEWRRDRDAAISFLCRSSGEWTRSREMWCNIADIDPAALRERMLKRLLEKAAA